LRQPDSHFVQRSRSLGEMANAMSRDMYCICNCCMFAVLARASVGELSYLTRNEGKWVLHTVLDNCERGRYPEGNARWLCGSSMSEKQNATFQWTILEP